MEAVRVCENCGARKPDWPRFGPLMSLVDNNSTALLQLFKGEFDAVKCQVCGGPLATPSISIGFDQHAEDLVFFGPLAREHPDDLEAIVNDATAEGTVVVADFDSPSALREAAWHRLSPRVAQLFGALDGLLADTLTDDEWERLWPELTSSAFAAYAVFLQVSLPLFVDAPLAERLRAYPVEQQLRGVQELQARVWCSVCSRWKLSAPPAATLEQDLARYGNEWGIITGAPERFIASFDALDTGTLDPAARYAFEAMQATLCAALGTENPHSEAWATIYLTVELLRPTSEMEFAKVLDALAISEERARGTVSRQALAVAVGRVVQEDLGPSAGASFDSAAMQAAVNKAGHPDLFGRIYSNGARMQRAGGEDLHSEDIALIVGDAVVQYASQPRELEVFLTVLANSVPATLDAEALVGITTSVEDAHGDNPLVRVALRIWLGRILCLRRQPEPFLKRIGADPEPWEVDLPLALKAVLWRWRATALRLTGNSARGLGLLASLVEEDEQSGRSLPAHLRQNVLGDLAIDYLNVGYHEQALRIQKALLQEPEVGRHPWHLAAVATTYERLGRDEDAVSLLRAALDATTQSQEQKRSELQAQLANVLSRSGDVQEALDLLSGLPEEALSDPTVAVLSAAAWMNLASEPTARDRVLSAARGVAELSQSSLARGDTQLHMTATRLFAMIIDRAGVENTRELWELVDSGARAYEGVPDPQALVVLAQSDWKQGNLTAGRERLLELPEALSQRFADTRDVAMALNSLKQLKPVLNALGDQVAHGAGSMADARLIAELQRDVLGRIAARASTDLLSGFVAPNDAEIAHLHWKGRPTCVLEWIAAGDGLRWLLTRVSEEDPASWWLEAPQLDVPSLSEEVGHRLSVWHPDRTGDPFDLASWRAAEEWLTGELTDRLPEGGQLVVIEHEQIGGLPWHVAAAPRWRASYAPSWSALLDRRWSALADTDGLLGLAMVPKYRESPENLRALETSVLRTVQLAAQLERELSTALREACDRDALIDMLKASAVAKVLCHGFVDPHEDVVALMVANDGVLPLADSVAANTPAGRRHRFDWRDCQQLEQAPGVVFSAACSSGQSHHAGLGEQLGVFSALRHAGTRSFVAPRWDINPEIVLPILDKAVERYLQTGDDLGEALHAACSQAGERLPRWVAWSLALEGDWR